MDASSTSQTATDFASLSSPSPDLRPARRGRGSSKKGATVQSTTRGRRSSAATAVSAISDDDADYCEDEKPYQHLKSPYARTAEPHASSSLPSSLSFLDKSASALANYVPPPVPEEFKPKKGSRAPAEREKRLAARAVRNRIAAQISRDKKRFIMQDLEQANTLLSTKVSDLEQRLLQAEQEKRTLSDQMSMLAATVAVIQQQRAQQQQQQQQQLTQLQHQQQARQQPPQPTAAPLDPSLCALFDLNPAPPNFFSNLTSPTTASTLSPLAASFNTAYLSPSTSSIHHSTPELRQVGPEKPAAFLVEHVIQAPRHCQQQQQPSSQRNRPARSAEASQQMPPPLGLDPASATYTAAKPVAPPSPSSSSMPHTHNAAPIVPKSPPNPARPLVGRAGQGVVRRALVMRVRVSRRGGPSRGGPGKR